MVWGSRESPEGEKGGKQNESEERDQEAIGGSGQGGANDPIGRRIPRRTSASTRVDGQLLGVLRGGRFRRFVLWWGPIKSDVGWRVLWGLGSRGRMLRWQGIVELLRRELTHRRGQLPGDGSGPEVSPASNDDGRRGGL